MLLIMKVQGIPSLSLNAFRAGGASKQDFIRDLGQAYQEIGFVAVRDHGIDALLLQDFYESVASFFSLSTEQKKAYQSGKGGQRGYTSFGEEHAKGNSYKDLKEFWHFGRQLDPTHPLYKVYPPNIVVQELPRFNTLGMQVYQEMDHLGRTLLQAIALFLELEWDYFEDKVQNGNSILRAIHYPPIMQDPGMSIRAGAHEDINLITLLAGSSAEGLQVLTQKGEWVEITHIDGHIVVNVGDMLQRLTNNVLSSTTHRVVNPPQNTRHKPRYSMPFFLHPGSEMDLSCLPSCVTEERPCAYEPITAGEYLEQRLREIGLL